MPEKQYPPAKVAMVTGATRGIGRAIASRLAQDGFHVGFTFHSRADLAQSLESEITVLGVRAVGCQMNLNSSSDMLTAVQRISDTLGPIDILVNNAAIAQKQPFEEISIQEWNDMLGQNLTAPFYLSQQILPGMVTRKWGRIVNVVSIGGQWGGIHQVHYAAAKAGLINLTRSLARLYSRHGITANAVSPDLVQTDMTHKELGLNTSLLAQNIPIGRLARPEDIAGAVSFLCSEDASYICGQTLNINGGTYFG